MIKAENIVFFISLYLCLPTYYPGGFPKPVRIIGVAYGYSGFLILKVNVFHIINFQKVKLIFWFYYLPFCIVFCEIANS